MFIFWFTCTLIVLTSILRPNYSLEKWGREEALRKRRKAFELYQQVPDDQKKNYQIQVITPED